MQSKLAYLYISVIYFIFISFITPCRAAHLLRAGSFSLPNRSKLVVVGIAALSENQAHDLDFESLGFQGKGMARSGSEIFT